MAELLRLESARLYGNHNPGCIWSFFHIFDSYQRRKTKRLLSYRRMGEVQYSEGTDIHKEIDEAGETVGDKGTNVIVEQRGNNMNKRSGKARILKFISKKLLKKQKHKEKMSHSSSKLMRTNSIHQSECNYFVPPDDFVQMTSDSETSTITRSIDDTDSLSNNEHESSIANGLRGPVDGNQGTLGALNASNNISCISYEFDDLGNHLLDEHIILKKKLFEARDALLKQKDTDPKGMAVEFSMRSKIFLDTLQLFNTNREALYNVCNGKYSFMVNDVQALGLSKSVSLSGSEFSGSDGIPIPSHKQMEDDFLVNKGPTPKSADSKINTFGVVPEVLPLSHELRKQRGSKTVLNRLRELKKRIKGVFAENRKVHHRISMDRILDKVPSGRMLAKGEEDQKLHLRDGSVSEKYYNGGQGFKVSPSSSISKIEPKSVQRSRSLAESLNRYSQLFDSISFNEWREAPERSTFIREESSLLQRKLPKTHERMLSNPELVRSYSNSKDLQREVHLTLELSKKETSAPDGSDKLRSLVMQPAAEEIACEQVESLDSSITLNAIKAIVSDKFLPPNVEVSATKMKGHGRQIGSVNIVEEKISGFNELENPVEDSPNNKPEKTTPVSVLDSNIEEESVSAAAGLELHLIRDDDLKEQHPITEPWKDNEDNVAELSNPDLYVKTSIKVSDHATSLPAHAHVDEKDPAGFSYVKHVLSKSGYDALFLETYEPSYEVKAGSHVLCDMPYEEQLIYDLIHEVLFEIYEHSTAPSSWLPHFHSKIRSMPTGSYLLEEVWAVVRWHKSSPQGSSTTVDDAFARSLAKDDGWMNLYRDAECYGLLLEQLILDELVDEVILDSDRL